MKKVLNLFAMVLLSSVCGLTLVSSAFAQDEVDNVIRYRQYTMSSISDHFKSLKYLSSGKITQPEQWLPHARALNDLAKMVPTMFPEGSDFGETDAKEAIWSNKKDFNQKAQNLVKRSEVLLQSIQNDQRSQVKGDVAQLGKACKACHKKYREK